MIIISSNVYIYTTAFLQQEANNIKTVKHNSNVKEK